MLPLLAVVSLLGCPTAWKPELPGTFDVAVPTGWEVTRNYRWLGTSNLTARRGQAALSVRVEPNRGRARRLPLSLVASARALTWGRTLGVQNLIVAEHEIVVSDQRGCAVTGLRRWRTHTTGYTMVIVRNEELLAELTLHAPPSSMDEAAAGWGAVLASFRLSGPAPAPVTFVDDAWPR